jgi:hypothetical protein
MEPPLVFNVIGFQCSAIPLMRAFAILEEIIIFIFLT